MTALAVLIPGLIVGAIAWGAVGVLRQRGREDFTLATAAAFYARVLQIAGVLAVLAGLGVLGKLGFSKFDIGYSYFRGLPPPGVDQGYYGPSLAQQQGQDLVLAAMLIGIGLLVAGAHWALGRYLAKLAGGSPSWIEGGGTVAVTVLTGLAGILSLIIGGYQALTYFLVGNQQGMAFGDPLGAAVVFVPAWGVSMLLLMRRIRRPASPPARRPALA